LTEVALAETVFFRYHVRPDAADGGDAAEEWTKMKIKGTKKQARKRHRQSLERRMRNRSVRSRVRRQMRLMRIAIADGDAVKVKELLPQTISVIDVGSRKGVLHRNTASRYKSRMARQAMAVIAGEEN
jgi:small subunit ribosomal protein S20